MPLDKIDAAMVKVAQNTPLKEVPVLQIPGQISLPGQDPDRQLPVAITLPIDLTPVELLEVYKFVVSALDVYKSKQPELMGAILVPNHQLVGAKNLPPS